MPFKSQAQRRFMFAAEDRGEVPEGTAERWAHHTKNIKKLPEHVSAKTKKSEDLISVLAEQTVKQAVLHKQAVLDKIVNALRSLGRGGGNVLGAVGRGGGNVLGAVGRGAGAVGRGAGAAAAGAINLPGAIPLALIGTAAGLGAHMYRLNNPISEEMIRNHARRYPQQPVTGSPAPTEPVSQPSSQPDPQPTQPEVLPMPVRNEQSNAQPTQPEVLPMPILNPTVPRSMLSAILDSARAGGSGLLTSVKDNPLAWGAGALGVGAGAYGLSRLLSSRQKKKEDKEAMDTQEKLSKGASVLRHMVLYKVAEAVKTRYRTNFVHNLDKLAELLPIEKQAGIRTLQQQLVQGKPLSHAIKTAYAGLCGEQRGILAARLIKLAIPNSGGLGLLPGDVGSNLLTSMLHGGAAGAALGAPAGGLVGAGRGNVIEGIGRGVVRGGATGVGAGLGAALGDALRHHIPAMADSSLPSILGALSVGGAGYLGSGHLLGKPSEDKREKKSDTDQPTTSSMPTRSPVTWSGPAKKAKSHMTAMCR